MNFFFTSSCNLYSSLHHSPDQGCLYTLPTLSLFLPHALTLSLTAARVSGPRRSPPDLSLQRLNKRLTFSLPCSLFTASRRYPAMNFDPPNSLATGSKHFFPRLESLLFLALLFSPVRHLGIRVKALEL